MNFKILSSYITKYKILVLIYSAGNRKCKSRNL